MSVESAPTTKIREGEEPSRVMNQDKAEVMAYAEQNYRKEAAHIKEVGRRVLDHASERALQGKSIDDPIGIGTANDLGVRSALPEFQTLLGSTYGAGDKEQQVAIGNKSIGEVSDLLLESAKDAITKANKASDIAGESYDRIQQARENLNSIK